jgi:virginiamycin A acetyltransferase
VKMQDGISEPRRKRNAALHLNSWRPHMLNMNLVVPNANPEFFMNVDPQYRKYDIGDYTYGKPNVLEVENPANLTIGKFCAFGEGVVIVLSGDHRVDWVTTYPFSVVFRNFTGVKGHPATKGDVVIGNDVWIGMNALILTGVTIGDGAVIGARAVVTKDVPPYSLYAGNPGAVRKKRFGDDAIEKLLEIKWWDFPDEKLIRIIPFMLANDVERFINMCEKIK